MMRWIVGSSLRARRLILALAAGALILGFTQLPNMAVDVLPEFTPPTVEVQTEALGLSATEVEQLITVPLEQDLLNGVAWLDTIRSQSINGLSYIQLVFEPGTDVLRARQVVQERLTQAHALPNVSKPPQMLQPLSSTNRVMMVGLSSEDRSLIEMSQDARWTIKPRLMGVTGVANVSTWGQRERQLQVQVDPERLRDKGVSLLDVITTTGNAQAFSPLTFLEASTPGTGGFIDGTNGRIEIQHILPFSSPKQLAQVPIDRAEGGGQPLRLGDVATVVEDHQPLIGDAVLGDGEGLLLVIEKFPGANTLEVTQDVESALNALRPGLSGMEIDTSLFRPASFIEMAMDNLGLALIIGIILMVLMVGALLSDWRTALLSLVAVLLSLTVATLVLNLRGAPFNSMVVAGLVMALVILIDDVILGATNIVGRLRRHRLEGNGHSTARVILDAALEAHAPIIYATVLILLALVPILFLDGVTGAFLPPLAFSYALAVLASLGVALAVTPALGMLLLPKAPIGRRESPLIRRLGRGYDRLLAPAIRTPRLALIAVCAVTVLGLVALPFLGHNFSPQFKDPDVLVQFDGPPGTSLPEMTRVTGLASDELRSVPGVSNVGVHVGRAVMSDQITASNSSEMWVSIDPAADYEATVASVEEVVNGYPGFEQDVTTHPQERIDTILAESDDDIIVRLFGNNLSVLQDSASEVQQIMAETDGLVAPHVQGIVQEPNFEIEVDIPAARQQGISPGYVRRASAALLSGLEVGSLFEDQKVFEVVVWGTPEIRQNLTDIENLLIDRPGGGHVRLGEVAGVNVRPTPSVISHEATSRSLDVGATLSGRSLADVTADIETRLQDVEFPLEHHAEVLADQAEQRAAEGRTLSFAIAAAIGIFLLLQAAFGSWRLASVVFLALPMALVGGVLAAFITGGEISLGSLMGFFAVLGIAARHAIATAGRYRHLERNEGEAFGPGLVLRGSRERFVPIIVSAIVAGVALLPLAVMGNIPGLELVQPMAVVIVGGLITSTLLNLFVMPALYLRFGTSAAADSALSQLTIRLPEVDLREGKLNA
ncbi:MAG: efflux RND transporter permease subunit [Actinobacteria bacterium]|nr:efflux RND transporter permease subunit [Actinomycetota bacterium]